MNQDCEIFSYKGCTVFKMLKKCPDFTWEHLEFAFEMDPKLFLSIPLNLCEILPIPHFYCVPSFSNPNLGCKKSVVVEKEKFLYAAQVIFKLSFHFRWKLLQLQNQIQKYLFQLTVISKSPNNLPEKLSFLTSKYDTTHLKGIKDLLTSIENRIYELSIDTILNQDSLDRISFFPPGGQLIQFKENPKRQKV